MDAHNACLYSWRGLIALWFSLWMPGVGMRANAVPELATGANVDESQVQNVYHVDVAGADAADDDKHGSADAPFATINYACKVAIKDKNRRVGAKVVIAPGVYRETVEIGPPPGGANDTDAPLVVESAEREQAIIDGADTEGWTSSTWNAQGIQWSHPWPFRRMAASQAAWTHTLHTFHAPPSALGEAYEPGDLIFVDGDILRQVNRVEDLAPGCFWGRAATAPGKATKAAGPRAVLDGPMILLQPPPDKPLAGSIIQVGTRNHDLVIRGRRDIVVRGLLFEHAAAPAGIDDTTAGLLLDGCSNVLVDDVLCQWNDGTGLVIAGRTGADANTDFTVRQSHLLHNGGSGLRITNIRNLLVEDTEACFNNFRGEWANWVDAKGPAGMEASGVQIATCRRLRAVGNFCRGVWWDGNDTDITLDEASIRGNLITGLCVEENPGPILIRKCLIAETRTHPSSLREDAFSAGVSLVATPAVTLESNILAANATSQLGVWEMSINAEKADAKIPSTRRVYHLEQHSYHHNIFYGSDAAQSLYSMPTPTGAGGADPGSYYDTVKASENCFWAPGQTAAFSLHGKSSKAVGKVPLVDQVQMNFEGWCTLLSERNGVDKRMEIGSLWQDPAFLDAPEGDFRLGEHSPLEDWGLPSDEGSTTP